MKKTKRVKGGPVWHARPHRLSIATRNALTTFLGDGKNSATLNECFQQVEYWLDFLPGARDAIDNGPLPLIYRREIKLLRNQSQNLLEFLNSPTKGINAFTRDMLSEHFAKTLSVTGPDGFAKASLAAAQIVIVCNSALKALDSNDANQQDSAKKKSSAGRKRKRSREIVIVKLVEIFKKYTKHSVTPITRSGFIRQRPEFQKNMIAFVRAALAEAKEQPFSDEASDKKWAALIERPLQTPSDSPETK